LGSRVTRQDTVQHEDTWDYGLRMLPQHAQLLRRSAVSPEVARARGYLSIDRRVQLDPWFGTTTKLSMPGLWIPRHTIDGNANGGQYRPDKPISRAKDGKVTELRYLTPTGQHNRLDVNSLALDQVRDPSVPLWITEGARKADAAITAGLGCASLNGVYGWKTRLDDETSSPIGDLDAIPLDGREVVLAFDSDVMTKESVYGALDALTRHLRTKAARVRFCYLPDAKGEKVGLDDYLAAGYSVGELWALVEDRLKPPSVTTAITLSDVQERAPEWFWRNRLPAGCLVDLTGDPGLGKSTLLLDIAARLTTGRPMPDETEAKDPGDVIVLSAEDSIGAVIVPRLRAAGANLKRVHTLDEVQGSKGSEPLVLPNHVHILERLVVEKGARLVVIDPVTAFLGRGVNSWNDQSVRGALRPLAEMADHTGCVVVIVRHLRKSGRDSAVLAGGGSIAFVAAARVGLMVTKHLDDRDLRVLSVTKSNVGLIPEPVTYRIVGAGAVGLVEWRDETIDASADELIAIPTDAGDRSMLDDAKTFLADLLANGTVDSCNVIKQGGEHGFSSRTLHRAKSAIGARSVKLGDFTNGAWVWRLEPSSAGGAVDLSTLASFDDRMDEKPTQSEDATKVANTRSYEDAASSQEPCSEGRLPEGARELYTGGSVPQQDDSADVATFGDDGWTVI
jgi:hypothetical protein